MSGLEVDFFVLQREHRVRHHKIIIYLATVQWLPSTKGNCCSRWQDYYRYHDSSNIHQNIIRGIIQKDVTLNSCTKCQVAKWTSQGINCIANCHCDDSNNSKSRYTWSLEFWIHSYWRYMALEIFTNWTELAITSTQYLKYSL